MLVETNPQACDNDFVALNLHQKLISGLGQAGFTQAWPIQKEVIPHALAGRDILGLAQTGTGKTAAFALPILHSLTGQRVHGHAALVLAPTRELAKQIEDEFITLGRNMHVRTLSIYGGVSINNQIAALRRQPQVLIACPGRLLDLMRQGEVRFNQIKTLVIDEADHMFDMGFLPDVKRILAALPAERQNMLFSATMPKEIRGLADSILREPQVIELTSQAPAETIEHALYVIEERQKFDLLKSMLRRDDFSSAIVFSRTKHRVKKLAQELAHQGHRAVALQGNMSQMQRDQAMYGFRHKKYNVLVATDIAARGIDVAQVSHVINFDVPLTPDAYTHRIGRTGRAQCTGQAFTFVTDADRSAVYEIEKRIGAAIPRRSIDGGELPKESNLRLPPRKQQRAPRDRQELGARPLTSSPKKQRSPQDQKNRWWSQIAKTSRRSEELQKAAHLVAQAVGRSLPKQEASLEAAQVSADKRPQKRTPDRMGNLQRDDRRMGNRQRDDRRMDNRQRDDRRMDNRQRDDRRMDNRQRDDRRMDNCQRDDRRDERGPKKFRGRNSRRENFQSFHRPMTKS